MLRTPGVDEDEMAPSMKDSHERHQSRKQPGMASNSTPLTNISNTLLNGAELAQLPSQTAGAAYLMQNDALTDAYFCSPEPSTLQPRAIDCSISRPSPMQNCRKAMNIGHAFKSRLGRPADGSGAAG